MPPDVFKNYKKLRQPGAFLFPQRIIAAIQPKMTRGML